MAKRGVDMGIDLIFKIAAIGILVSIVNAVLKQSGREEMAMMTALLGLVIVLLMVAKEIVNLFNTVKALFQF
jgi:stage III sporulation protein AC